MEVQTKEHPMNYLNLIVDEARIVELHIEAALSVRVSIYRNTGVTPGLSDQQNLLIRSMAALLSNARSRGADQALAADFINMADELKESVSTKAAYLELANSEILPWENPAHYAVNAVQNVLRKIDNATGSSMIMGLIKLGLALGMVWAVKEEGKGAGEFLAAVAGMVFVMISVMARVKGKDLSIASFVVGAAIAYGAIYFTMHSSTENALGLCAVGGVFALLYILIANAQQVDPGMGHSPVKANGNVVGGPEENFKMTNPATGLPMIGEVDIEGNPFGSGMDR